MCQREQRLVEVAFVSGVLPSEAAYLPGVIDRCVQTAGVTFWAFTGWLMASDGAELREFVRDTCRKCVESE